MKYEQKLNLISYISFGAVALAVLIATTALNAVREYDAVRPIEFLTVPLCLIFTMVTLRGGTDKTIVLCAFVCTTIADLFMILLEKYFEVSLVFFAAAQLIYCARIQLFRKNKKYSAIALSVRAALSVIVCAIAATAFQGETALIILAAFYFTNLALNAAEALISTRGGVKNILFFAGLILFMGCDICVGLNSGYMAGIRISSGALYAVIILIWLFYIPSQILLALSVPLTHKKEIL